MLHFTPEIPTNVKAQELLREALDAQRKTVFFNDGLFNALLEARNEFDYGSHKYNAVTKMLNTYQETTKQNGLLYAALMEATYNDAFITDYRKLR